MIAEYAVRNSRSPMGISEYKIREPLPEEIQSNVPAIELLQEELSKPFILGESLLDGPDLLS